MVIVVVKNLGGSSQTEPIGMQQERKRSRALPPEGWIGESKSVKKRQVGERAERLKHILEISTSSDISNQNHDAGLGSATSRNLGQYNDSIPLQRSPTKSVNGYYKTFETPLSMSMKSPSRKSSITNASAVADTKTEESYDWRENLIKMREQIKAVQDLPKIHVPEPIKYQKFTSSSTPNLSQFSDKPKWSCESSWEIRAKYRSMRTEELYQSQLIKKSGYSWRDKVPEIQKSLKFTEVRSNVVTDVAFIGSSYVRQKNSSNEKVDKSKNPQVMMSKSYGIDSSINIFELVIKDNLPHDTRKAMKYVKLATYSIEDVNQDSKFLERLWQMIKFFSLCWQLKLCHPGFDLSGDVAKIIAAAKVMETIMEVDETPDLEECKKAELDITGGDIKTKMTGAIAGLQLVKKKAPTDKPKQPMKVESKISSGGTSGDWRSEIKKRERAKQQEKLNAMPLGMPDYREPEKLQVVDWREKLKKEAADDNPMNKWKKFDNGVKKTVRPPPQKPKPKPSKVPKEDPCTCNVGNCKVHSKFVLKALKSTSKKTVVAPEPKSEEPVLKRKPSVKKKVESNQQPGFSKTSKTEVDNKTSKSPSEQCSRASSVVPEDEKIEVIKIINFVAIKVTTRASDAQKKRKLEDNSAQPPPPSHPPPSIPKDDSPPTKISSPSTSSMSPTPPPLPPPILFPPLALKSLSSPPIVREPSFLQVTKEIIPEPAPKPKDKSPSPVYQRKYFPNPEPMEYYKPKIHDYTPATVKLKRTEENYEDDSQVHKVQFSTSLEVTPVKFSSNKDNYVKKARFVGDSYMGDGINKFQESIQRSDSMIRRESEVNYETDTCDKTFKTKIDDSTIKQTKKKASDKIIEILTAKKIRDEKPSESSPLLSRRRLSEYVSEKLLQAGKSRSNTPVSPTSSRKKL